MSGSSILMWKISSASLALIHHRSFYAQQTSKIGVESACKTQVRVNSLTELLNKFKFVWWAQWVVVLQNPSSYGKSFFSHFTNRILINLYSSPLQQRQWFKKSWMQFGVLRYFFWMYFFPYFLLYFLCLHFTQNTLRTGNMQLGNRHTRQQTNRLQANDPGQKARPKLNMAVHPYTG